MNSALFVLTFVIGLALFSNVIWARPTAKFKYNQSVKIIDGYDGFYNGCSGNVTSYLDFYDKPRYSVVMNKCNGEFVDVVQRDFWETELESN